MIDLYTILKEKLPISGIKNIYRCSGLLNLEEVLRKNKAAKPPYLVVEEASPIGLDVSDKAYRIEAPTFYVIRRAVKGDDESRVLAKHNAYAIGEDICWLLRDLEVGLDLDSRINCFPVGPLPHEGFGYGFTLSFKD